KLNHRANLWALKEVGASHIIGTSSTGSLKKTIHPGTFVVPDDFVAFWNIPTFVDDRVVHSTPSLDAALRRALVAAAKESGASVKDGGSYVQTTGPRLETRAEIAFFQKVGDVVGMTMASEATLACGLGKRRESDTVLDGRGKIALPGFVNLHTHAAMTLFRGYADDLDLSTWLETRIWPAEAKLSTEDVCWGTKLACLEMIKSGTTTFNDMYFHMDGAAKAVKDMGLRAFLAEGIVDLDDPDRAAKQFRAAEEANRKISDLKTNRIRPAFGPHAIYTVSKDSLLRIRELADKKESLIHIHLSETKHEVGECLTKTGLRPAKYLQSIGFLGEDVIVAHGCWLDPSEIEMLARAGAKVAHCPVSNMKLSTGAAMPYRALREAG